jgi:hypothetical protein
MATESNNLDNEPFTREDFKKFIGEIEVVEKHPGLYIFSGTVKSMFTAFTEKITAFSQKLDTMQLKVDKLELENQNIRTENEIYRMKIDKIEKAILEG